MRSPVTISWRSSSRISDWALGVGTAVVCLLIYLGETRLAGSLDPVLVFRGIWTTPFWEEAVWIYVSQYALLVAPFLFLRAERRRYCTAIMLTYLVAGVIHLAIPSYLERPSLSEATKEDDRLTALVLESVYSKDQPVSVFPSLHMAGSLVAVSAWWKWKRKSAPLGTLWCLAIAVSTLAIRQHVLADLIAGVVLGWLSAAWLIRPGMKQEARSEGSAAFG